MREATKFNELGLRRFQSQAESTQPLGKAPPATEEHPRDLGNTARNRRYTAPCKPHPGVGADHALEPQIELAVLPIRCQHMLKRNLLRVSRTSCPREETAKSTNWRILGFYGRSASRDGVKVEAARKDVVLGCYIESRGSSWPNPRVMSRIIALVITRTTFRSHAPTSAMRSCIRR